MKVISSIVLAGIIGCSGCSSLTSSPSSDKPSTWSRLFPAKVAIQLSVINAEPKSPIFINGKNKGKANRGGTFASTFKVKKDDATEIEFRIKRFSFGHIFRQEKMVRQTVQVTVNSIVVCDGKKQSCTVSSQ